MNSQATKASVVAQPTKTLKDQSFTNDSDWFRVAEACRFARISKPLLYNWLNRGLVKNVALRERGKIKGLRLISRSSLSDFLESRATGGAPQMASETVPEGLSPPPLEPAPAPPVKMHGDVNGNCPDLASIFATLFGGPQPTARNDHSAETPKQIR